MANVKLYFSFVVVLYVFTDACFCYADSSRFQDSQEKVEEVLKHLNKPHVKSIKSPDGDIIDCVHISRQPAFDHPLLKNHTIKMRPNYHPNRKNVDATKVSSMMNATKDGALSSYVAQLWHLNGKCPKGTIPIRRTKKEDVLRASSVESYGKKKRFSRAQTSFIDVELDVGEHHEYAIAYTNGKFYGAKATLNVWNPWVQESKEFSLAQIWIVGGSLDTVEAGWHVNPLLNGDTNTRFFIYWTRDGYQTTGCYNLGCSGFIQTNNRIAIGGSLSPISQIDGSQYEFTILIWKDWQSGDWWMQLGDGEVIGYWPSSLFSYLSESASLIEWGGEVVNLALNGQHTTTDMGSGRFPNEGLGKASYIRHIETVDESNTLWIPDLDTDSDHDCYDILTGIDDNWGRYFYFGGSGRNTNCP